VFRLAAHDSLQGFVSNEHVDHSAVSVTGTGALTGGGDLTSSRSIDVAVNGVGTSELDESAGFSFSNLGATTITGDLDMSNNNINDVASIDGDGDTIGMNDSFDFNNKHSLINLNRGENAGGSGIEWSLDSSVNVEAGKASIYIGDDDTPDIEWQRNANVPTAFRVLDRTNVNILMDLDDSGNLDLFNNFNLKNSGSIQDAGVDMIVPDGTGVPTFPNKVVLNGFNVKHDSNRNWFFDQETNNGMLMRNLGGGDFVIQTTNSSGSSTDRLRVNGGVDTANFGIENTNLDLNGNDIVSSSNFNLQHSGETILQVFFDRASVVPDLSQPGNSTEPALSIGNGGAGFFINSSGEVVVVDEAGNTTTIS